MIDLTITSPPYDNMRKYTGECKWTFNLFKNIANELYRVTRDGGVVVWIVGDSTIKGTETGTSFEQALYFKSIGFNLHDTMIWQKKNPIPQVKQQRYWNTFEYMFILSKGKPNTFNGIQVPCKYAGHNYSGHERQISKDKITKYKEYKINKQRIKKNIWDYAVTSFKSIHSAVFPEDLIRDHILTWSNEGDIILDPFVGSGTTIKVAEALNRYSIGIEVSKDYIQVIKKRIRGEL